jgi:hypothetical protein
VTTAGARAFLTGLIDYAGLFPPAGLGMKEAVAEYARYHGEPEAWMLGRFVVPAARFDELEEAMVDPSGSVREDALGTTPGARSLSALVGPAFTTHAAEVLAFNARHAGRARVDSVEFRASTRAELDAALDTIPEGLTIFVELPLDDALDELLPIVKARGARAKVRTGGVVPEAIPEPGPVARLLKACASAGVPLKATAGLHHPVRAEHPLTYEPGAPRRTMHGFLNVFGAAVLAWGGMTESEIETILREADPTAFRFDDEGFCWRDQRAWTDEITRARQGFAASFGSCSFTEPVADLRALGVVP